MGLEDFPATFGFACSALHLHPERVLCALSLRTTGKSGHCWRIWTLLENLDTAGESGHCWRIWALLENLGTAGGGGGDRGLKVVRGGRGLQEKWEVETTAAAVTLLRSWEAGIQRERDGERSAYIPGLAASLPGDM